MVETVIVDAVRTPVGRRRGGLAGVHPVDLSAHVLRALVERTGIDPAEVDDVIWGCVTQVGEQSWNVARGAVLAAGWPETVPGTTLDRQCGSSQQAIHFAAAAVASGQADAVVAGGVESMSRVPLGVNVPRGDRDGSSGSGAGEPFGPSVRSRYAGTEGFTADAPIPFNQGVGAELIARRWGLSRGRLDEYALRSHQLAAAASDGGRFGAEIAPVAGVKADEGIRRDTSLARLAELKTPFATDGVVTAGSASQISDGAAAVLVCSAAWAKARGLAPLATIRAAVVVGDDPVIMLTAPIPATARVLRRAGLSIADIGAYEVNEAFAPVPLAWLAETDAVPERLNPLGGAIALGHPVGGSGARLATTLLHHMRSVGIRYGLQTMCEGGGMANATIYELPT